MKNTTLLEKQVNVRYNQFAELCVERVEYMRNLIIKRNKTFVGCATKLKVYIEDSASNEITINGVPCRKLGTIKNGEEQSFLIDANETRVFVIADKLSKDYCNEFYNVPVGTEDVYISGQCKFNPANGNAFRFDGITDEEVLKNRKKGTKKGMLVLIVAAIVGAIVGWGLFSTFFDDVETTPKQFTVDNMQITLTSEFETESYQGLDEVFVSNTAIVLVLKEEFALLEGLEDYTLQQYGELVIENNGLTGTSELEEIEGLLYFDYENNNIDNITNYYFATIFKSDDAFWLIQFAVPAEEAESSLPQFIEWAKTITFIEQI